MKNPVGSDQLHHRRASPRLMVLALGNLVLLLSNGCLSRPALVKQTFALASPTIVSNSPPTGHRVLAIRRLTVDPPFDSPSLVYRTGEFSYERDHYASFLASPAESFFVPVREYFRGQSSFRAVSESGSALKADVVAEVSIDQLYGDFRKSSQPTAVLGIRFVFFDAPNGLPGPVLLEQSYLEHIPIPSRTPAALVAGWNEALRQVLSQADLRVPPAPRPSAAGARVGQLD